MAGYLISGTLYLSRKSCLQFELTLSRPIYDYVWKYPHQSAEKKIATVVWKRRACD